MTNKKRKMSPDKRASSVGPSDKFLEELNNLSDKELLYLSSFYMYYFDLEQLKERFAAISEDYQKRSSVPINESYGGEAIAALFELLILCPCVLEKPVSFEWVSAKFQRALNKQRWHKEYHRYFWEGVNKARAQLAFDKQLAEDIKIHVYVDYYMMEKKLTKNAAVRKAADELDKDERHIHRALKRYQERKPL